MFAGTTVMNKHEVDTTGAGEPADSAPKTDARRELIVIRAGTLAVAVFADETEGIAEARAITPLPHAPSSVLGVASVRGRMRTALDPFQLLGAHAPQAAPAGGETDAPHAIQNTAADAPRFLVTLRGDEQLALSAASVERHSDINSDDIQPPTTDAHAVRGVLRHGNTNILLLDPAKLFDAATQSTERRRRRQKQ